MGAPLVMSQLAHHKRFSSTAAAIYEIYSFKYHK